MKIRIVKNSKNIGKKILFNNTVLRIDKEPTEVGKISKCRYFLYDIEKNKEEEILKEVDKYDLFDIKVVLDEDEYIYFLNIDDITKEKPTFNIYKFDLVKGEYTRVYSFENTMEQYLSYMRTRIFVVNNDFMILQNEFLRANLTEDFEGYFDFELQLYSVLEDKIYKVIDENLSNNGINDIISLDENVCAIKTGFSLLEEERYNRLSKNEVSVEGVSIVNILQLVSDMMIMKNPIVLGAIDQSYYDATIPYIEKNSDFLIYSKVNFEKREEEIVFYNYSKKEAKRCINKNIYSKSDLGNHLVINDDPYVMHIKSTGIEFYNIEKNKVDIKFDDDVVIEAVKNNFVIVSQKKKGLFCEKNYIMVYKYPLMNMVHKEKGVYKGCLSGNYDEIFILLENKGEE